MKNDDYDSRPAILVIDDEPDFLDAVSLYLKATGSQSYEIITTSNPTEVNRILADEAGRLRMILLDMHMPEYSGLEVLRWIRAHPLLENIPIIMLSGDHMARRHVADTVDPNIDFLLKPFDPELLYYRIKRFGAFC